MIGDEHAAAEAAGAAHGRKRDPAGRASAARPAGEPVADGAYCAFVYLSISARASSISAWPSTPLAFTSSIHLA